MLKFDHIKRLIILTKLVITLSSFHCITCFSCYVRTELNSTNSSQLCNADKCQPATEQYWERYVLGVHKAKLGIREEFFNATSAQIVNKTYAFAEVRFTRVVLRSRMGRRLI